MKRTKQKSKQQMNFNENNLYGILKQAMEIDTDVNEDANRERLLDDSVEAFVKNKL